MKKLTLFFLVSVFTSSLFAEKVGVQTAIIVAKNFYASQYQEITGKYIQDPQIMETFMIYSNEAVVIYVFNFESGFVLVSGDNAVVPVLGFSIFGKFITENQPPALIELLETFKNQISVAIKNDLPTPENEAYLWSFYQYYDSGGSTECEIWPKFFVVNPLLETTWNQGCWYNYYCPSEVLGPCSHTYAGCVALAMAQVMKYWDYPTVGSGSHSYDDGSTLPNSYGYQYAEFGSTYYDWDNMPNSLTSASSESNNTDVNVSPFEAVATLIYHCGVSVDMDYGYEGSGAHSEDIRDALVNYFLYSSSANYQEKSEYVSSTWEAMLIDDLNNHYPIIYSGNSGGNANGHQFVLDGYTKMVTETVGFSAYFHVNWGWGGYANGYFFLDDLTPGNLNFNYNQTAVLNVKPSSYSYPAPPQPSYISEPACDPHCRDIEVDYFVPLIDEMTSYEWDITGITAAGVTGNGRYAQVWSHHYGTGTLWCRALNHGVAGPWQTRTIYIEDCSESTNTDPNSRQMSEGSILSIGQQDNHNGLEIYPIPTHDFINLKFNNIQGYTELEILNNIGIVVKKIKSSSNPIQIDVSDIPTGMYIIKLSTGSSIKFEKVLISD